MVQGPKVPSQTGSEIARNKTYDEGRRLAQLCLRSDTRCTHQIPSSSLCIFVCVGAYVHTYVHNLAQLKRRVISQPCDAARRGVSIAV